MLSSSTTSFRTTYLRLGGLMKKLLQLLFQMWVFRIKVYVSKDLLYGSRIFDYVEVNYCYLTCLSLLLHYCRFASFSRPFSYISIKSNYLYVNDSWLCFGKKTLVCESVSHLARVLTTLMIFKPLLQSKLDNKSDRKKYFNKKGSNTEPGTPTIMKMLEQISENDKNLKVVLSEDIFDVANKSDFLRVWKGNKSAAKSCKHACAKAFKEVCIDYKCSKSMKRSEKKMCKEKCNREFRND